MDDSALISVILPCYNAEKYVQEAIISILNQTYSNLELIVINDGSTDGSLAVIERLAQTDKRLVVISRENRGLIATLNEGIALAQGAYIARMDADDISLPDRFQRQIAYMQQYKLDLVGGAIARFYPDGSTKERPKYYPKYNDELVASLLTMKSRIAHPTVLAKRIIFDDFHYDPRFKHAEDYALWLQIALGGKYKMGNLPAIVLRYRSHPQQVHALNKHAQKQMKKTVFVTLMSRVIPDNQILLDTMASFWQNRSLVCKVNGLFNLAKWLKRLECRSFYNKRINLFILKRAFEQIF